MIFIVVLNWRGADDTIACLQSLLALQGADFQIVVCDNGSGDGSYERIRSWLVAQGDSHEYLRRHPLCELSREEAEQLTASAPPGLFLVQTGANLGYSGGNNVGIRLALTQPATEFVWLLNNDTEVEPNSLLRLLERCHARADIGICGSKLVYHHDRSQIQGLGGLFNPWLATSLHYQINQDSAGVYQDDEVDRQIDYVVGASLFIRASLLRDVGLLEERYFLYFEEIDLARRARGKYAIGMATASVVYHKEGASTEGGRGLLADFYVLRNRLVYTWLNDRKYIVTVWLGLFVALLNRLRRGEGRKAWNVARIILGCRRFVG
jgi:GT2 family glycosyltransferase